MPRLFLGTFLGEDGVQKVAELQKDNANLDSIWNSRVRWVSQDKLHLTWLFLGDTDRDDIGQVKSSLEQALAELNLAGREMTLHYRQFELWPNERKARVGALTPDAVPEHFSMISQTIRRALKKFLPADEPHKVFKPHVTVLRLSPESAKGFARSARCQDIQIPISFWPVLHCIDEIDLIESDMGKRAAGYQKLAAYKLV